VSFSFPLGKRAYGKYRNPEAREREHGLGGAHDGGGLGWGSIYAQTRPGRSYEANATCWHNPGLLGDLAMTGI
jgi:hypothetical protein